MAKACYTSLLAEKLHQYRTDDILCDAIIETQDAPVLAHSLILAAASDQLRISFLAAEKGCRYQLRLDNYASTDVLSALKYIYTGTLLENDSQDQFDSFEKTVALLGELGVLSGRTLALDDTNICAGIGKETTTALLLVSRDVEGISVAKDDLNLLEPCAAELQHTSRQVEDDCAISTSNHAYVATLPASNEPQQLEVFENELHVNEPAEDKPLESTYDERCYVCAYCDLTFETSSVLIAHVQSHGDTLLAETFPHSVDTEHMSTRRTLVKRTTRLAADISLSLKSHVCGFCGKLFRYRSHLGAHMRVHVGDTVPEEDRTCTVCGRQFRTSSGLRKHRRIHDSFQRFECGTCQKVFAFQSVLREHERKHSSECPYVCETCGRNFKHSSNLFKHQRLHHKLSTTIHPPQTVALSCANCNASGTCLCQQRIDMVPSVQKRYQCDICKKCFSSSSYREIHLRVHTGERPFECKICKNSFNQKPNLMKHMQLHAGDRHYSCRFCNKSFTLNCNLREHEKIHTDDRQFPCSICDKRFITAAALRAHQRCHGGVLSVASSSVQSSSQEQFTCESEKSIHVPRRHTTPVVQSPQQQSHRCDLCPKAFRSMLALRRHAASHSSNRPHWCDVCGKSFKYLSNLNSHRSSAHGVDSFSVGQLVQDLQFGADTRRQQQAEQDDGCSVECESEMGINNSELLEISEVTNYQLVCIAAGVPTFDTIE